MMVTVSQLVLGFLTSLHDEETVLLLFFILKKKKKKKKKRKEKKGNENILFQKNS